MLFVVLLACLQLRTISCKRLWQWRIMLQPPYLTQQKELQAGDSTSKRSWVSWMMQRHMPTFKWVLPVHTPISLMICSTLSRTWQLKLGLTVQYSGTASPKTLSARLLEQYVFLHFKTLLLSKNFNLLAHKCHNYFKKFPHGWAIEEFLKSNLKNKHLYACKWGYLGTLSKGQAGLGQGDPRPVRSGKGRARADPDPSTDVI